jgi:hypothetical protein
MPLWWSEIDAQLLVGVRRSSATQSLGALAGPTPSVRPPAGNISTETP